MSYENSLYILQKSYRYYEIYRYYNITTYRSYIFSYALDIPGEQANKKTPLSRGRGDA